MKPPTLLVAVLAVLAAQPHPEFTPRRMSNYDERAREGQCVIRVWVDDEVDVELRGDRIRLRTITGAPGRDDGSECNQPLPRGDLSDFRFRGIDGRGEVRLVQEPGMRNGYTAVVNIRDKRGGGEGYTFRLSWTSGGGRAGSGGGGSYTPARLSGAYRGRGTYTMGNSPGGEVTEVNLELRPNGEFYLEFRSVAASQLSGRWRERGSSEIELDVRDGFRYTGADGRGTVYIRRDQIDRIVVSGTARRSGDRYNIDFTPDAGRGGRYGR